MNWLHPPIYIIDIYVEPVSHGTVAASLVLAKAPQLQPGERIDDTARLQRMQELIDTGLPTKTAARRTVIEMPSPPAGTTASSPGLFASSATEQRIAERLSGFGTLGAIGAPNKSPNIMRQR